MAKRQQTIQRAKRKRKAAQQVKAAEMARRRSEKAATRAPRQAGS